MKMHEFGERCEFEGILWSELVLGNEQLFDAIKTALVSKFEFNLSLTAQALDEHDDEDYINAHLAQKEYDLSKLKLAKKALFIDELLDIDKVFIRQRDVVEHVGCDYWSLLAAKQVGKTTNE